MNCHHDSITPWKSAHRTLSSCSCRQPNQNVKIREGGWPISFMSVCKYQRQQSRATWTTSGLHGCYITGSAPIGRIIIFFLSAQFRLWHSSSYKGVCVALLMQSLTLARWHIFALLHYDLSTATCLTSCSYIYIGVKESQIDAFLIFSLKRPGDLQPQRQSNE